MRLWGTLTGKTVNDKTQKVYMDKDEKPVLMQSYFAEIVNVTTSNGIHFDNLYIKLSGRLLCVLVIYLHLIILFLSIIKK